MASARVLSVQVGTAKDEKWAGQLGRTAIDKGPVAGPVTVRALGIEGDEQADQENHGGLDQAVYAYAAEDLDWWVEQLGRELRPGIFGENVTTAGLDVTGALVGEVWRLGTAVVQVTSPRIPCGVFRGWMGERGWVKRYAAAGRPGAYLRVLAEGQVQAGDTVEVVRQPACRVTVAESMRAYYGDAELLRRLLLVEGRGTDWDAHAARVLRGQASGETPATGEDDDAGQPATG